MVKQIACFLTTWDGDGTESTPFVPTFADNMQAGEYWANNLVDLLAVLRQYHDDLPPDSVVEKHSPVQSPIVGGIGFVYVYAEHTRIISASANANYLGWWSYNIDRQAVNVERLPTQNPSASELTALQDYLVLQTGKTLTQIATFLRNLFGVADNANLQTWILGNARKATVNKLSEAFATQEQRNA